MDSKGPASPKYLEAVGDYFRHMAEICRAIESICAGSELTEKDCSEIQHLMNKATPNSVADNYVAATVAYLAGQGRNSFTRMLRLTNTEQAALLMGPGSVSEVFPHPDLEIHANRHGKYVVRLNRDRGRRRSRSPPRERLHDRQTPEKSMRRQSRSPESKHSHVRSQSRGRTRSPDCYKLPRQRSGSPSARRRSDRSPSPLPRQPPMAQTRAMPRDDALKFLDGLAF